MLNWVLKIQRFASRICPFMDRQQGLFKVYSTDSTDVNNAT